MTGTAALLRIEELGNTFHEFAIQEIPRNGSFLNVPFSWYELSYYMVKVIG